MNETPACAQAVCQKVEGVEKRTGKFNSYKSLPEIIK
jgi:hypothetical protein